MTQFRMVSQEEASNQQFRFDLPVYAYIRFSTLGQVKDSKASKVLQDTRMHEKLMGMGFTDIRRKDKDEGISAQKGTDERLDLADIYRAMEKGRCAAIAAYDASRLWRDRDRVYYNDFIKRIKKYNVPVILHNKTYWPKIESDMELLRAEFEYSQKALSQFYDKACPARQEAVLAGSYGGHCVPVGYVVVGEEKMDKHYMLYEPHRKLVEWIFMRYRALGGNLGRLHKELVDCDFHFPEFDAGILRQMGARVPHVALTHDDKGYKLQSRNGLISLLTNRAYLGWYVYNSESEESRVFTGEYINKESHDPAFAFALFQFAYSRLSKYNLDGTRNEEKPEVERHYADVKALLEGLISSDGIPVYCMSGNKSYTARKPLNGWKSTELVVSIEQIDTIFAEAMIELLRTLKPWQELTEKVAALEQEHTERACSLEQDIVTIDQGIREWELAKRVSMAENDEPGVTEAVRALKKLRADRAKKEAELNRASTEASALSESHNLISEATKLWQSWHFEKRRRMVKMVVDGADIREVSPHVLRLTIVFSEPINSTLIVHIFRARGSRDEWNDREKAILRRYYPSADRALLMEKLPTRTWESIIMQSRFMGLSRTTRANTSGIPDNLCFADVAIMRAEHMDMATKQPVWCIAGIAHSAPKMNLVSMSSGIL